MRWGAVRRAPHFQVGAGEDRKNIGRDCLERREADLLDVKGLSNSDGEHRPWLPTVHVTFEECVAPHSAFASCMIDFIKSKFSHFE